MKKFISLFTVLLSMLSVPAAAASPILLDGIDIRPLVEYFGAQVTPLQSSVTIYNWSVLGETPAPQGLGLAKSKGYRFWNEFGTAANSNNLYGGGLYGAVDPAVTVGYGGGGDGWLLIEMKLPVGMQLLDLNYGPPLFQPSEEVQKIAAAFNCPQDGNPNTFFASGGFYLDQKCKNLVQKVFQDNLKIDGIIYPYSQAFFKECQAGNASGRRAFVILDSKWMKLGMIQYYTAKNTANLDDRIRIQTLLLKARMSADSGQISTLPIASYLDAHPDRNLKGSKTVCEGDVCVITVQFCDAVEQCEDIQLAPLPRPGGPLLTAAEAQKSDIPFSWLWPDLEGQPKSKTVSTWLTENKYACTGKLPITPAAKP